MIHVLCRSATKSIAQEIPDIDLIHFGFNLVFNVGPHLSPDGLFGDQSAHQNIEVSSLFTEDLKAGIYYRLAKTFRAEVDP